MENNQIDQNELIDKSTVDNWLVLERALPAKWKYDTEDPIRSFEEWKAWEDSKSANWLDYQRSDHEAKSNDANVASIPSNAESGECSASTREEIEQASSNDSGRCKASLTLTEAVQPYTLVSQRASLIGVCDEVLGMIVGHLPFHTCMILSTVCKRFEKFLDFGERWLDYLPFEKEWSTWIELDDKLSEFKQFVQSQANRPEVYRLPDKNPCSYHPFTQYPRWTAVFGPYRKAYKTVQPLLTEHFRYIRDPKSSNRDDFIIRKQLAICDYCCELRPEREFSRAAFKLRGPTFCYDCGFRAGRFNRSMMIGNRLRKAIWCWMCDTPRFGAFGLPACGQCHAGKRIRNRWEQADRLLCYECNENECDIIPHVWHIGPGKSKLYRLLSGMKPNEDIVTCSDARWRWVIWHKSYTNKIRVSEWPDPCHWTWAARWCVVCSDPSDWFPPTDYAGWGMPEPEKSPVSATRGRCVAHRKELFPRILGPVSPETMRHLPESPYSELARQWKDKVIPKMIAGELVKKRIEARPFHRAQSFSGFEDKGKSLRRANRIMLTDLALSKSHFKLSDIRTCTDKVGPLAKLD